MCKTGKQIVFCRCINEENTPKPYKKSKRWQVKNPSPIIYMWSLSQFVENVERMMEGQISEPSEKLGEDLTNDFVLGEINSRNCFDFEYFPQEGDCLSICRSNKTWHFFSYIFREGEWKVGMYNFFYQQTKQIDSGKMEIQEGE